MGFFSRLIGDFNSGMDIANFEKNFDEFFESGSSFMDVYAEVKGDMNKIRNYENEFLLIQTKIDLLMSIVYEHEKSGTIHEFIKNRIKTTNFKSLSINDALVLMQERIELLNSAVNKQILQF